MLIYRHLAIMVYSEKLLNIKALMKCEDDHTNKKKMPKDIIAGFFGYISDKDNYQYYQNTTMGFEFTNANFKIKKQSKIAKGDK